MITIEKKPAAVSKKSENLYTVDAVRWLTDETYALRFERKNLTFSPGQTVHVKFPGQSFYRDYTIYSGHNDAWVEILVREIPNGYLTPSMARCKPGDTLEVHGPIGFFNLPSGYQQGEKVLLIASGTGISPFHSFVRSYPRLNYMLIHGIRHPMETYDRNDYSPLRYVPCVSSLSQSKDGYFSGRVTDYLRQHPVDRSSYIYLCGNFNMIRDAIRILIDSKVDRNRIHVETYF